MDEIKLPPLPSAWGTMYGKYQDREMDGYTADQMRGYAIDALLAAQLAAPASLPNCAQCNGTGQVSHRGGYTACYTCGGSGVGDAQLAAPGAPEPKKADFYCFPAGTYPIDKPAPGERQPVPCIIAEGMCRDPMACAVSRQCQKPVAS